MNCKDHYGIKKKTEKSEENNKLRDRLQEKNQKTKNMIDFAVY